MLALTEGPIFSKTGMEPTAQIYFCPSQGDGVIFEVKFGDRERMDWREKRAAAVSSIGASCIIFSRSRLINLKFCLGNSIWGSPMTPANAFMQNLSGNPAGSESRLF